MRHYKRSSHKLLAAFLALVMLLSSFNAAVFAANAASPAQEPETLSDGTFAVEGELAQNLNPSDIRFNNLEWTGEQITASVNSGRQSQVYEVNRVTPHATLMPYETAEKAIIGARDFAWEQSGYYMPLTEEQDLDPLTSRWQFAMVDTLTHDLKKANETKDPWNPTENIVDFYKTDYNAENWPGIAVPTNWQLQGVGRDGKPYVGYYDPEYGYDAPYFSDPQMPDKVNVKGTVRTIFTSNQSIPLAPADYDPVGFYRRSFDVPAQWISEKNKVFISFGGVEAAYYVYLNGYEVGYHEDSKTPGEFDLTPFLTGDGKNNLLAVKVIRYADSTWIEDQDYINLSGIFRDVYLMATPALHMQDYKVETDFDTAFRDAALKLNVQVNNYTAAMHPENYAVGVQLFDADGKDTGKSMVLPLGTVHANGSVNVNGQMQVEAPHKWFPDDPYLYTLVLSLYDRETGVAVEHISQQLGFREITYRQQDNDNEYDIIRINGQKILMMGVNTHTTSPDGGHYMSKALMEQDMKTIKQSNMNAIRTAHYPPCTYTLYLADRYGVMVILEANNESHGDWQYGANTSVSEENFYAAANSRVQNIVQEEKNRTSVVMWSLGNESGAQNNWANILENVHKVDHTRPVHYEGFHSGSWGVNRSPDVHSSMYSSPSVYAANCDDDRSWAPSTLLCEFNHAIGNGLGMLSDYTDVFRSKKNAMGGLIWDFDDMAIWTKPTATIGYREDGPNGYLGTSENMVFTEAAEPKNTRKLLAPGSYIEYPNHAGTDGQDIFNEKISGRNPFTLEVWAAPTAGNNDAALIAKGDTQFALKNEVDGANNNIQFSFYTNNRWRSVRVKQPDDYLNGELHHIVGTFDGNVARLYYDGAEVGSYTFAAGETIQTNSYPFAVGRSADRADRNSVSYIAGARVYSRALSAEEITDPNRQPEDDCPAEEENVVFWTNFSKNHVENGPYALTGTEGHITFAEPEEKEEQEAEEQEEEARILTPGSYIVYQNTAGTNGQDIFNEKISGTQPFSVEVWAAPTSGSNDAVFVAKGDTHFSLKNESDGNLQFSFYTNNKWRSARMKQPADYLNGELHHIVGTFDGSVARIYYDGVEMGSYTFAAGERIVANSYPFAVGSSTDRSDRNSVSNIAGARIFTRALTPEEIADPDRKPQDDCPEDSDDVLFWTNFKNENVETGPYGLVGSTDHMVFADYTKEAVGQILTPGSYIVYQNTAGTNGQDIFNEKISGTQPFSVEVWAAPTSGSNDAVFVAKGDTHFSLKNESDGNLQFSFFTNNSWRSARMKQPADYLNGELHHIVGTFDGSIARIYYDGVETGSYTFAAGERIVTNSYPFAVGSSTDRSDRNSVSNIAGARIFTRALTPEEIADPDRKPQDDCPEDSEDVLFWTNFKNENVETGPYGLVGSTDHMQFAALSEKEKESEQASRSYGRCLAAGSYMVFEDVTNVFNNKISGNQPFSVEVWASPYTSLNDCGYVAKGDHHFALKNEPDGNMQFSLYTNHGWRSARCKQPDDYLDGTLHHIVGTFDGTTAKIYYDGEELGSYTFPSGEYLMTSSSAFAIGKDVENSGRESSADIAAVRIYTRALRSEEATDETRKPTDACPADDPNILLWADFSRDNMEEQAVDMWDFYGNGLYMGYGGDWGEFTNDSYQAANGIISPNRTIQPELANAKKLFQHLNFSAESSELAQGTIHVRNEYYATNGNAFTYRWFLQENGKVIDSGTLENVPDMPAANNGMDIFADLPTVAIHVPYQLPEALRAGAEYFLTIQACLPEATDWAEAGFIVAQEQFPLSTETAQAARKLADGKLTLTESEEAITVCGENFSVALDKADGVLRDYTVNGTVLLAEGPTPEFSRHKSGGDRGDVTSSVWNNIDSKLKAPAITVERGDQDSFVTLNVKYPTAVSSETFITMTYRISADGVIGGTIALETDVEADAANNTMYRFGVDMVMPEGYEQIDWLTRGPEDNYLDRKDGTFIGQYQTTVTDNFYVYVHSQNSGAHQDTRWMALRNPDNTTGLMFVATDGVMEANAVHFDWTDLNEDHPHKLHPRQETVVSLSGESRGVGGNLAGILPHYRVLSGNKTFKYTLVPFAAAEEDLQTIADPYRTTLPTEDTCPSKNFADVPAEDHWAHAGIDYCIANGYMSGMSETTFVPAGIVTRAQLVTILYRIAGEPAVEFKGTFEDVAESQFYSAAVEWAAANGIVNGVSETAFDPEGSITREQVAAILYRYSGCPAVEGTLAYRDAFRVSGYAKNAMLWAVNEGIINGVADPHKPTMLEPYAVATRDQIASIIMRFLEK